MSVATRPDVAHVASLLSQFNGNFNKSHCNAAKREHRDLKGTNEWNFLQALRESSRGLSRC